MEGLKIELPKELNIETDAIDEYTLETVFDCINNYLSNAYGFCVKNYGIELLVKVTDIEWEEEDNV